MKPQSVLSKDECKNRMNKRAIARRNRTQKSIPLAPVLGLLYDKIKFDLALLQDPSWNFTPDELNLISQTFNNWIQNASRKYVGYYSTRPHVFFELMKGVIKRTPLSSDVALEYDYGAQFVTNGLLKDDEWKINGISTRDLELLSMNNSAVAAAFFQNVKFGFTGFTKCAEDVVFCIMKNDWGGFDDILHRQTQVLRKSVKHLNMGQMSKLRNLSYDQVYVTPWAQSREDEVRHLELAKYICDWPTEVINDQDGKPMTHLDLLLVFFLCSIILYSADNITGLENPGQIRIIQDQNINALYRYLRFKHPYAAEDKFRTGMEITRLSSESAQIASRRQALSY